MNGTLKKNISLDDIIPSEDNLRHDLTEINDLAQSIAFIGLLEPIRIYKNGDGKYHIRSGHRRYAALRQLEKDGIVPEWGAIVTKPPSDEDRNAEMLIENMQRVNLSPLEQAEGVRRLIEDHDMSVRMMATALGVTQEWVKDRIAMIGLPEEVTAKADELGVSGLAAFGKLDEDRQKRLLKGDNIGKYKVEDALSKQQSKARAEATLAKKQKEGYLCVSMKHLKRLVKEDLHEMAGLDQLVKLKLENAKQVSNETWNGVSVPTAAWDVYHVNPDEFERDELYVLVSNGGYMSFHKVKLVQPDAAKEAAKAKQEKEYERKKAKADKARAAQDAAIIGHIDSAKIGDLTAAIVDDAFVQASGNSRNAHRACVRLGIKLDIDMPEGWNQSYGPTRNEIDTYCREQLLAYAAKSNANKVRAVAALLANEGRTFGADVPEMPEDLKWV